ncbi:MAG: lyase [Gemmatimonadota bacterium]
MLLTLAVAVVLAPPAALDTIRITEWTVPWENSRPRDPYVDPKTGRIWFVGQAGNYVAYFVPGSTDFKRYELDEGVNPHNIIVDTDGTPWYAGNRAAHIGKLDPATGKITKYPMPDPAARDPHTMMFDGKGGIWFSLQNANMVGHLNQKTGAVKLVKMTRPNARPYGLVVDETGQPWFCEFGTNRMATIDPKTFQLKEYDLPAERARPRRMARTPDGIIWYGDYSRGFLGRLDPKTGEVREWPMPSGARSLPYAMTMDDQNRIWFVETGVQPNNLVGFDPRTEKFFSNTPVLPSGAGTIRHMVFHKPTRSIWFGTDTNQLGRAVIPVRTELVP